MPGNLFRQSPARKSIWEMGQGGVETEQGFCCCCCHLQQSAFEFSEIRKAQDILKETNAENRNDQ